MSDGMSEYWKAKKAHKEMMEMNNISLATKWIEANRKKLGVRSVTAFWDHEKQTEVGRVVEIADLLTCPAAMSGIRADEIRDIFLDTMGTIIKEFNK